MANVYVFLDPDGSQRDELGLFLLVICPTGVIYGSQVAGYATLEYKAEGFLVPLGQKSVENDIVHFFWEEFRGQSYPGEITWTVERLSRLDELIAAVRVLRVSEEPMGIGDHVALDRSRLTELVEGWVPVDSPYGPAVLLFKNCD